MPARSVVLASSSRYRRQLLERLRIAFTTASPDIDEAALPGEAPRTTALRLAELKARAVAARMPDAVIIGSDQVASLDGEPIGKPGTREAALDQLVLLAARTVVFHTAVCIVESASNAVHIDEVPTRVAFRRYSRAEAERYLAVDEPYDCAGSAKIESLGIALVERVESTDPTALIGLPLISVVTMLAHVGIDVLAAR